MCQVKSVSIDMSAPHDNAFYENSHIHFIISTRDSCFEAIPVSTPSKLILQFKFIYYRKKTKDFHKITNIIFPFSRFNLKA